MTDYKALLKHKEIGWTFFAWRSYSLYLRMCRLQGCVCGDNTICTCAGTEPKRLHENKNVSLRAGERISIT